MQEWRREAARHPSSQPTEQDIARLKEKFPLKTYLGEGTIVGYATSGDAGDVEAVAIVQQGTELRQYYLNQLEVLDAEG